MRHGAEVLAATPASTWDLEFQTVLIYLLWPNTIFIYQRDHIELFRVFPGATVADSEASSRGSCPGSSTDGTSRSCTAGTGR